MILLFSEQWSQLLLTQSVSRHCTGRLSLVRRVDCMVYAESNSNKMWGSKFKPKYIENIIFMLSQKKTLVSRVLTANFYLKDIVSCGILPKCIFIFTDPGRVLAVIHRIELIHISLNKVLLIFLRIAHFVTLFVCNPWHSIFLLTTP